MLIAFSLHGAKRTELCRKRQDRRSRVNTARVDLGTARRPSPGGFRPLSSPFGRQADTLPPDGSWPDEIGRSCVRHYRSRPASWAISVIGPTRKLMILRDPIPISAVAAKPGLNAVAPFSVSMFAFFSAIRAT